MKVLSFSGQRGGKSYEAAVTQYLHERSRGWPVVWEPVPEGPLPRFTEAARRYFARRPQDALWYWMNEREAIRQAKEAGENRMAWTPDPVLFQYRFCNVFREEDRVTKWVDAHIRKPYADHPALWFMLCIARYINWPATLQAAIESNPAGPAPGAWPALLGRDPAPVWVPGSLAKVLQRRADNGEKTYTGAYMIRAESDPKAEWYNWPKSRYIAEVVLGGVWRSREDFDALFLTARTPSGGVDVPTQPSLEAVWTWLTGFYGWGPFMAYEVVTDLRHTRYLRAAPDIDTWANAGPGAKRGLNRIEGLSPQAQLPDRTALAKMQHLLDEATGHASPLGKHVRAVELRDIEHSLCETDKYLRVVTGEGAPRAKYVPDRGW